ncbi:MFS transporter [Levilactobacillus cerevisiae]|uniref:MFS transporter n=1 Tax=Levilactobacillus cerevisiae TaxID=1704076 RepID=UPI000F76875E|nr:MFS transporter [Levilactobacillus cerevisiae]
MLNVLKNQSVRVLSLANVFETLGISIFNIVLLTYAKTYANPAIMVSVVSIATVVPGTLGFAIGFWADHVTHKDRMLILTKVVQAALYLLLAVVIDARTVVVFTVVVAINLVSDCLGFLSSSLRLPVIRERVARDDRQQVLGFNQSIASLLQPVGQSIGVFVLAATHDYALAALINAGTFLIAAAILLVGRHAIHIAPVAVPQPQTAAKGPSLWQKMSDILGQSSGVSIVRLLSAVVIVNAVGASVDAVINLYLLDQGKATGVPFGMAILIVNVLFVIGTVMGSTLRLKFLDRQSFKMVMVETIAVMVVLYLDFLWLQNYWLLVVLMFAIAFGLGNMNPKLYAQVISIADQSLVGTIFGTVSSLVTVAAPVGSVGIVLLYNAVSPAAAYWVSIAILVLGTVILLSGKSAAPVSGD